MQRNIALNDLFRSVRMARSERGNGCSTASPRVRRLPITTGRSTWPPTGCSVMSTSS
ncbi:hypothetical protein I551_9084 [Mycobacterium ulcerans str. Harvey]|uniref:Uncharacterized protein n=1 Tax=Mycobacterium ulcerans str. Harvey TaxID=1299332 RepID=A0ABP3ATC2_MYCUL|nr:hypothetical protein I551_9084 [Mycobacterium ulcerans str. Harvey]